MNICQISAHPNRRQIRLCLYLYRQRNNPHHITALRKQIHKVRPGRFHIWLILCVFIVGVFIGGVFTGPERALNSEYDTAFWQKALAGSPSYRPYQSRR